MRWHAVAAIFGKELRETVRDRRTLFAMIALPVLLQPVLMLSFGGLVASEQAAREQLQPNVVIWGPLPEPASQALTDTVKAHIVERHDAAPAQPAEEARTLLRDGKVDVVVSVPPDAPALFTSDGSVSVSLYFDSVNDRSSSAHDHVEKALFDVTVAQLHSRLAAHGLPKNFTRPLALDTQDLASKENKGDDFAGRVLPMVLLLMVLLGAVYPAIDMTAGEKERGTLQTLLCAPVRPVEIVAGKYMVVVLVALASAAVNLAAMGFAISRQLASLEPGAIQFSLGPRIYLAVLVAMIPAVLLLAALLLGLAVFARSFREAQTYITPIVTAIIVPGFVAVLPSVHLDPAMALVPVVNLALLLRELLRGDATAPMYLLVTVSSMLYATLAILFAARVFESEQVLLGGERPWRDVFGRRGIARTTPSPPWAVLFVALLLGGVYYGSLLADPARIGFVGSMLVTQLGLLLGPALLTARLAGAELVPTFSLRWPTRRAWAGAAALAAGAWSIGGIISSVEEALVPGAQSYFQQVTHEVGNGTGSLPLPVAVLLMAVLPAMAEEACFRGFVLSGLANTGSRAVAIIGSGVAFGLLHLSPFHIVPAAALGIVLGFATLESGSLLAGMLIHVTNNALAVISERFPTLNSGLESPAGLAAGLALSVTGLVLLKGSRVGGVNLSASGVPHRSETEALALGPP
jgi:sodium transport system permease protein